MLMCAALRFLNTVFLIFVDAALKRRGYHSPSCSLSEALSSFEELQAAIKIKTMRRVEIPDVNETAER